MQGDGKSFRVSRREAASGQRSKESQKASWSATRVFSGHESLDNRLGFKLYLTTSDSILQIEARAAGQKDVGKVVERVSAGKGFVVV